MFTGFATENTPAIKVWNYWLSLASSSATRTIGLSDDCPPIHVFNTGAGVTPIQVYLPSCPIEGKTITIINQRFSPNTQNIRIYSSDSSNGGDSLLLYSLGQGASITLFYSKEVISGGTVVGGYASGWIVLNGMPACANNSYAISIGGTSNSAVSSNSAVIGGNNNNSTGSNAITVGGSSNTSSGSSAIVIGGSTNTASGGSSAVVGGSGNTVGATSAVTLGGINNNITSTGFYSATLASDGGNISGTASAAIASSTPTLAISGNNAAAIATNSYSLTSDRSAILGGSANTVSLANSVVIAGTSNTSSGGGSVVVGGTQNAANALYSIVSGGAYGTTRSIIGNFVTPASNSPVAVKAGATQSATLLLGRITTDSTATALTSNASAASTTNQVILPNNSAYYFRGSVIAYSAGGDAKAWTFEGAIKRGATAASTAIVGTVILNVTASDPAGGFFGLTVTADTTNGGLAVSGVGQFGITVRWVCKVETTEVTY